MARPRLRDDLIREIATTFDKLRRKSPGKNVSGETVWNELKRRDPPGKRTVESLVAQFKREGIPTDDNPWHVDWDEADDFPERIAHLLGVQAAFLSLFGRGMTEREARWAGRLRRALEGDHWYAQVPFVVLYSQRELLARLTQRDYDTGDLDYMLALNLLFPEDSRQHALAVREELVPEPPSAQEIIDALEEVGSKDARDMARALGDFFRDYSDNPLQAIRDFVDPIGGSAKGWAVWSHTDEGHSVTDGGKR